MTFPLVVMLVGLAATPDTVKTEPGPAEPSVEFSGDLPKTGKLGLKELEALGPVTVAWNDHGETHQVTGVPLQRVLAAFGFSPGPRGKSVPIAQKRAGWRKSVVAVASDGYQVAFSCAEVSDEIGATRVLVAWKMDGELLRPETGPIRLVALTDHEAARSVHRLQRLVVVDLTQPSR